MTTRPTDHAARGQLWADILAAIDAGCPIPGSIYLSHTGGYADVHVLTPDDVHTWARHLDAAPPTVRVHTTRDGRVQRDTQAERRIHGQPWISVNHSATLDTTPVSTPAVTL